MIAKSWKTLSLHEQRLAWKTLPLHEQSQIWIDASFDEREDICRFFELTEAFIMDCVYYDEDGQRSLHLECVFEYQSLSVEFISTHLDVLPTLLDKYHQNGWVILSYGASYLPASFITAHSDKLWMESEKIQKELSRHRAEVAQLMTGTVLPDNIVALALQYIA